MRINIFGPGGRGKGSFGKKWTSNPVPMGHLVEEKMETRKLTAKDFITIGIFTEIWNDSFETNKK